MQGCGPECAVWLHLGTSEMLGGHQLALRSQVVLGQTSTSETGDGQELGARGLSLSAGAGHSPEVAASWAASCVCL